MQFKASSFKSFTSFFVNSLLPWYLSLFCRPMGPRKLPFKQKNNNKCVILIRNTANMLISSSYVQTKLPTANCSSSPEINAIHPMTVRNFYTLSFHFDQWWLLLPRVRTSKVYDGLFLRQQKFSSVVLNLNIFCPSDSSEFYYFFSNSYFTLFCYLNHPHRLIKRQKKHVFHPKSPSSQTPGLEFR